jgi:hypothetical protein
MHRLRGTCHRDVTVLHTASVPTAISTGTRSTGLLCPFASIRPQPTTAGLTGSSTVNHTNPQSTHCRFRTVTPGSLLFVATALTIELEQRWHCIGIMQDVPHWSSTMRFGEWMLVELSPEQQFEIEKQARTLLHSEDAGVMAAALLKQACYQQQLLQQAVNEIARLELELM